MEEQYDNTSVRYNEPTILKQYSDQNFTLIIKWVFLKVQFL